MTPPGQSSPFSAEAPTGATAAPASFNAADAAQQYVDQHVAQPGTPPPESPTGGQTKADQKAAAQQAQEARKQAAEQLTRQPEGQVVPGRTIETRFKTDQELVKYLGEAHRTIQQLQQQGKPLTDIEQLILTEYPTVAAEQQKLDDFLLGNKGLREKLNDYLQQTTAWRLGTPDPTPYRTITSDRQILLTTIMMQQEQRHLLDALAQQAYQSGGKDLSFTIPADETFTDILQGNRGLGILNRVLPAAVVAPVVSTLQIGDDLIHLVWRHGKKELEVKLEFSPRTRKETSDYAQATGKLKPQEAFKRIVQLRQLETMTLRDVGLEDTELSIMRQDADILARSAAEGHPIPLMAAFARKYEALLPQREKLGLTEQQLKDRAIEQALQETNPKEIDDIRKIEETTKTGSQLKTDVASVGTAIADMKKGEHARAELTVIDQAKADEAIAKRTHGQKQKQAKIVRDITDTELPKLQKDLSDSTTEYANATTALGVGGQVQVLTDQITDLDTIIIPGLKTTISNIDDELEKLTNNDPPYNTEKYTGGSSVSAAQADKNVGIERQKLNTKRQTPAKQLEIQTQLRNQRETERNTLKTSMENIVQEHDKITAIIAERTATRTAILTSEFGNPAATDADIENALTQYESTATQATTRRERLEAAGKLGEDGKPLFEKHLTPEERDTIEIMERVKKIGGNEEIFNQLSARIITEGRRFASHEEFTDFLLNQVIVDLEKPATGTTTSPRTLTPEQRAQVITQADLALGLIEYFHIGEIMVDDPMNAGNSINAVEQLAISSETIRQRRIKIEENRQLGTNDPQLQIDIDSLTRLNGLLLTRALTAPPKKLIDQLQQYDPVENSGFARFMTRRTMRKAATLGYEMLDRSIYELGADAYSERSHIAEITEQRKPRVEAGLNIGQMEYVDTPQQTWSEKEGRLIQGEWFNFYHTDERGIGMGCAIVDRPDLGVNRFNVEAHIIRNRALYDLLPPNRAVGWSMSPIFNEFYAGGNGSAKNPPSNELINNEQIVITVPGAGAYPDIDAALLDVSLVLNPLFGPGAELNTNYQAAAGELMVSQWPADRRKEKLRTFGTVTSPALIGGQQFEVSFDQTNGQLMVRGTNPVLFFGNETEGLSEFARRYRTRYIEQNHITEAQFTDPTQPHMQAVRDHLRTLYSAVGDEGIKATFR